MVHGLKEKSISSERNQPPIKTFQSKLSAFLTKETPGQKAIAKKFKISQPSVLRVLKENNVKPYHKVREQCLKDHHKTQNQVLSLDTPKPWSFWKVWKLDKVC